MPDTKKKNEWSARTSTNWMRNVKSIPKQFGEIGDECIHDRRSLDMHEFALSPTRRNTPVNNSRVPLAFGKVAKVRTHRESLYGRDFNAVNVAKCRWVITKGKWPIRYDRFHLLLEGNTSSWWPLSLMVFTVSKSYKVHKYGGNCG